MKSNLNSRLQWENKIGTEHTLHMQTDWNLQDVLDSKDPEGDLLENKDALRLQLFKWVIENHIPQVAQDTGVPVEKTSASRFKEEHKAEHSTTNSGAIFSIQSNINTSINIQTDQETNPIEALLSNTGAIASALVENVIFNLENQLLGRKNSEVDHSSSLDENGRVLAYKATEKKRELLGVWDEVTENPDGSLHLSFQVNLENEPVYGVHHRENMESEINDLITKTQSPINKQRAKVTDPEDRKFYYKAVESKYNELIKEEGGNPDEDQKVKNIQLWNRLKKFDLTEIKRIWGVEQV